jgi:hypothetical protein
VPGFGSPRIAIGQDLRGDHEIVELGRGALVEHHVEAPRAGRQRAVYHAQEHTGANTGARARVGPGARAGEVAILGASGCHGRAS